MVDDQDYAYDYDNARPMLARKYDICQGSETFEYRTLFWPVTFGYIHNNSLNYVEISFLLCVV